MPTAKGTFSVKITPLAGEEDMPFARMRIDKVISGDLEATTVGQMMAFRSAVEGSAGYVAEEIVTGSLEGRSGSFVFQHASEMNRGAPTQSIRVIPDSGTDGLAGLSGSFVITIDAEGGHSYGFDYELGQTT
ncbi:MAG: DUF3224 domain-containing protein [Hyphomicrobiaceae bacterium]|nr:DUF3224 domain-containing protein [Hyphomicrobiaceae bacterium]MCC0023997.1 DUF3224 domain-containing protein [Hyphomicrobiaceae bacterium]